MYKAKQSISTLLIAMAMGAQAQTPAKELVKNNPVVQIERGHAVDVYGDYSIIGSKGGFNSVNGAGTLFYQNQYVRDYHVTPFFDGLGRNGTVAIDQHALVLSAPEYSENNNKLGKIAIYNKSSVTGVHYSASISQSFSESTPNTEFGRAISISDDWIAVGAPKKTADGGVKVYYRNPSNGTWIDKGWLTLPDFSTAPFRFRDNGGPLTKWDAGFGVSLSINHNNLIVGAPGVGSFYIYQYDGSSWKYVSRYTGSNDVGYSVSISDEYAVASGASSFNGNNKIEVSRKTGPSTNPWVAFQTLSVPTVISGVAIDNNKLVVGEFAGAADGKGQVTYFESKSHPIPNSWNWEYNFIKTGKMFVSEAQSPNGLKEHKLLGMSVAIYQTTVVAGAPNAAYTGVADGAGFKADFSQSIAAREESADEVETGSVSAPYLYPNPASEAVQLSVQSEILAATAISTTGVKASLAVVDNKVSTSGLTSGLYTVTVTTKDGVVTQNVVIK